MSEPSKYGTDPIGTCLGCGKDLDAGHYCYGCRTHVCGGCDVAPVEKLVFRKHDPYDHLREDWCEDE